MSALQLELADLLRPSGQAEFFESSWQRAPLVLKRGNPAAFDGLFGLDELEEYLFIAQPKMGEIQLLRENEWPPGTPLVQWMNDGNYPIQPIFETVAAGYTLVVNAVHQRWPPIRRLVGALERVFRCRVATNIYVTGPASQGFSRHIDTHDVFVLQTYGSKRWLIYPRGDGKEPTHDFELECGDVIYLPKEFPHEARTTSDFSIHVSVGVYPYTWGDLLDDYVRRMIALDSRWNVPVPIEVLDGAADPPTAGDLGRWVAESGEKAGTLEKLMESYRTRLASAPQRSNPSPGGYLRSMIGSDEITLETRLEHRPGSICHVAAAGDTAVLHFSGRSVRAPVRLEPALRYIAATSSFSPSEIDAPISEDAKLLLARRLIREGLLRVG